MLVGKTITVAALIEKMEANVDQGKMEIPKLRKQLSELNDALNKLPKLKNEPPTEEMVKTVEAIRKAQEELNGREAQLSFLKRKLDEAYEAPDKQQIIHLTLRDCLFYGVG
jgi:hypothetical protein